MSAASRWTGYGQTDRGLIRATNQDALYVDNEIGFWIVADGMGGHAAGDVASRLAVERLCALVKEARADPTGWLETALHEANRAVHEAARQNPAWRGMGTTVVAMMMVAGQDTACIGHVGDSRAYHLHAGALRQVTCDHTVTEDAVRAGLLSDAEARQHPHRHILSRAVGPEPDVQPDIATCRLVPGDTILLCTDGLTKMLDDRRIAELLTAGGADHTIRCAALIGEANRRGGEDNTTVVLVSAD